MNQQQLDQLHRDVVYASEEYKNGMVTIVEFLRFCAGLSHLISVNGSADLCGLVCPQTGMPFPTAEEIKRIDDFVESRSIEP